jgi:hypothetical protein
MDRYYSLNTGKARIIGYRNEWIQVFFSMFGNGDVIGIEILFNLLKMPD